MYNFFFSSTTCKGKIQSFNLSFVQGVNKELKKKSKKKKEMKRKRKEGEKIKNEMGP